MDRSFFGLPKTDDPEFYAILAERNVDLLRELKYVSEAVGGLTEARKMTIEVRRWWIEEMQKDNQAKIDEIERAKGIKRRDV